MGGPRPGAARGGAGEPPSGAAGGYGWFDLYALLLAPGVLRLVRRVRARVVGSRVVGSRAAPAAAGPGSPGGVGPVPGGEPAGAAVSR